MERIALNREKENKFVLEETSLRGFVLDLDSINENVEVLVKANSQIDLLLLNLRDEKEINIALEDNVEFHLAILGKDATKSFKITANVGYKSNFVAYFADFIPGVCKGQIVVNLNKEYASCDWHLASLTMKQDKKEFDVSVFHNDVNTFAQMDNYGVCRDEGKLVFSGICKIENGSHGSKAHQNAKIMVFDEKSNGIAKPILKIDENDIEASHAAVVGKINDEHIFYLTSRGLSEDEAKRIITLGYLKPILKGFSDEEMVNTVERMIEGEM